MRRLEHARRENWDSQSEGREAVSEKKGQKGSWLKKQWFLVAIVVSIVLARWRPEVGAKNGPLRPEVTVKYGCVIVIFGLSGLSLKPQQLASAISHWKLHSAVQGFTLGVVPIVVSYVVAPVLRVWKVVPGPLVDGFVAVSCTPPPVSSAVILTRAVGGNEAAAVFNSAAGSLLGVFVTPSLLVALIGGGSASSAEHRWASLVDVLRQLSGTILLPLAAGQAVRPSVERWLERTNPPLGVVGQVTLLLIIYTTFCDAFLSEDASAIGPRDLAAAVVLVVCAQLCASALIFVVSKRVFAPADVVCAVFCASHKSLTLGIPVLKLVFADDPRLPSLAVPLLVYHPTQILLGSCLVPAFQDWLRRATLKYHKHITSSQNLLEEGGGPQLEILGRGDDPPRRRQSLDDNPRAAALDVEHSQSPLASPSADIIAAAADLVARQDILHFDPHEHGAHHRTATPRSRSASGTSSPASGGFPRFTVV